MSQTIAQLIQITNNRKIRLTPANSWLGVVRVMLDEGVPTDGAETNFNWNVGSWVFEKDPQIIQDVMAGVRGERTLAHAVQEKSGLKWIDFWNALLATKPWGDETPANASEFFNQRRYQHTVNGVRTQSGVLVVPLVRRGQQPFYPLEIQPATDSDGEPNIAILDTVQDSLRSKVVKQAEVAGAKSGERIDGALFGMQLALASAGHDGTGFEPEIILSSPNERNFTVIKSDNLVQRKKDTVSDCYTKFVVDSNKVKIEFEGEDRLFDFLLNAWYALMNWQRGYNKLVAKNKSSNDLPAPPSFCVLVSNVRSTAFTLHHLFQLAFEAKRQVEKVNMDLAYFKQGFSTRVDKSVSIAWGVPTGGTTAAEVAVNPTPKDQVVQIFCDEGFALLPIVNQMGLTTVSALEQVGIVDSARRILIKNLCDLLERKDQKAIYSGIKSSSSRWGTGVGAFGKTYR
ncbi:uncharacterized protein JCM6883_001774 [Sporobolomyces salmoneus]|uniref:uncharacterized protein n=1 Tax=Sporobolomyces salmoneus TaxID=183962 RepID=UPI0031809AE8